MKIPQAVLKHGERRSVIMSVRTTEAIRDYMKKYKISPTALFNWAIEKIQGGDSDSKT